MAQNLADCSTDTIMTGRKAILVAAIVVGAALPSARARAEGAPAALPSAATGGDQQLGEVFAKERPVRRVFYGWQILATGEVAALVITGSVVLPSKPLDSLPSTAGFVLGMPTYLLAGPIIHWSHDNFTKGLVSLGSNAAFALAGGFIGEAVRCSPSDAAKDCGERGFFTGLSVGALISPLVDAVALGWEYVPLEDSSSVETARATRAHPAGFAWSPAWTVGPRGSINLGVIGRF
jgi:hypothetical protein